MSLSLFLRLIRPCRHPHVKAASGHTYAFRCTNCGRRFRSLTHWKAEKA